MLLLEWLRNATRPPGSSTHGSCSQITFVPFPDPEDACLHGGEAECVGANVTVETAHVGTDCVMLASCAG